MAAFLNGLMGALKGLGGKGSTPGLIGSVDAAVAGTPGGASATAGSGGLLPAAQDFLMKDDGYFLGVGDPKGNDAFSRNEGAAVMRRMPTLEAAGPEPKMSFFDRINAVDPTTGMSTVDRFDRLGAAMRDDDSTERLTAIDQRAAGRLAKSKQAELAAQIDALFPDDPRMQFLLKANPQKATEALADVYKSRNEAYTLSKGQRRGAGGRTIDEAPDYGVDDGYAWERGADGFSWGDQRPPTWQELEAGRHNRVEEGYGGERIALHRARLALERERARRAAAGGSGATGGMPPLPPGFRITPAGR
ncbi:MAG: hypothetical protein JNK30_07160 [Phenylobacterium sp.]|uniref:hypothetical protein n=1 Tax=Phenylobacterium sp. TaxID=1871053 RepID=UPI001A3B3B06|nr:hypothetical protein [Phenylobacterium sp.]MBL8771147.1 hypothetical protein [Phenylobacterium sp.]